MPELRLCPISETLDEPQLERLNVFLKEVDAGALPPEQDELDVEESLSDTQLDDFMDKLEAHEIACALYVPVEFEGRTDLGDGQTVGSTHALINALDELREYAQGLAPRQAALGQDVVEQLAAGDDVESRTLAL